MALHFRNELDPRFLRAEWFVQRVGWLVLLAILVAAIAGLFGGGLFSETTSTAEENGAEVTIHHPRWGRMESPTGMKVEVEAPGQQAEELSLTLSHSLAEKIDITSVVPEPDSNALGPKGVTYSWQVEDWSEKLIIAFNYRVKEWKSLAGDVILKADDEDLATVHVSQFMFP
jgi:hypothetical protein